MKISNTIIFFTGEHYFCSYCSYTSQTKSLFFTTLAASPILVFRIVFCSSSFQPCQFSFIVCFFQSGVKPMDYHMSIITPFHVISVQCAQRLVLSSAFASTEVHAQMHMCFGRGYCFFFVPFIASWFFPDQSYFQTFQSLDEIPDKTLRSKDGSRVCQDFVSLVQEWLQKIQVWLQNLVALVLVIAVFLSYFFLLISGSRFIRRCIW